MTNILTMMIRKCNDVELLQFLQSIENEATHEKEVLQMCVIDNGYCRYNGTTLMLALNHNKSTKVLLKLIEIGGKDLVMMVDKYDGRTALHYVCGNGNISIDVVTKLIETGGQELIMVKDFVGRTALHHACENRNEPIDIVSKLIEFGG